MSEKWVDESITTRVNRTPEQRAMDARHVRLSEHEELELKLDCHYEMIQEQSAIITGQRAAIEALREVFEEVAQGHRHLAGRMDKVEKGLEVVRLDTVVNAELSNANQDTCIVNDAHIERLEAQAKRVIAAYPLAGKPTIQEQCDAVGFRGPTEEDEG